MNMKTVFLPVGVIIAVVIAFSPITAIAMSDRYQELSMLPFKSNYPTDETVRALDEELYFQRAVQIYLWALPAVNMYAMKEGLGKAFG